MTKTSGQLERERRLKQSEIIIKDVTVCHYCNSTGLAEQIAFCPNCRFPQRGSQSEMKNFLLNITNKNQLLSEQKKAIEKARNILFILAAINFVVGILLGVVITFNIAMLIGSMIGAGIYFGLGMWSRKKPFPAILSGFFVYIVFNVIAAITDPHTLYQGILWKVLIISGFIYGYKGVKDSQKLEKELASMKESKDLSQPNDM